MIADTILFHQFSLMVCKPTYMPSRNTYFFSTLNHLNLFLRLPYLFSRIIISIAIGLCRIRNKLSFDLKCFCYHILVTYISRSTLGNAKLDITHNPKICCAPNRIHLVPEETNSWLIMKNEK